MHNYSNCFLPLLEDEDEEELESATQFLHEQSKQLKIKLFVFHQQIFQMSCFILEVAPLRGFISLISHGYLV